MSTSLEDHDAVIKVHRKSRSGEICGRKRPTRVVGIQFIDEILSRLDERSWLLQAPLIFWPIRRVHVFDNVNPSWRDARIQELKRPHYVIHQVATIIDHCVRDSELVQHPS